MIKSIIRATGGVKLKACPYCGGKAELLDSASNPVFPPKVAARCTQCGVYSEAVGYNWPEYNYLGYETITLTRTEAAHIASATWNARSPREYRRTMEAITDMLNRNRCFDGSESV